MSANIAAQRTLSAYPVRYGTQVFEQLRPIFEASVCASYKNDFLVHDKRMLELSAVPGVRYLWVIHECGTHLAQLYVKDISSYVGTAVKRSSPDDKRAIYMVTVTADGCNVAAMTAEQAMLDASKSGLLRVSRDADPKSDGAVMYGLRTNRADGRLVASALVKSRYDRERNRTVVDIAAVIPDTLDSLAKMNACALIEDACSAEAGSLFWAFDGYTVNGYPFEHWCQALTERHAQVERL